MHSLRTSTLHISKNMEPLTWTKVCPSHFYECTLTHSYVLYCHYWSSVSRHTTFNIQTDHSCCPLVYWPSYGSHLNMNIDYDNFLEAILPNLIFAFTHNFLFFATKLGRCISHIFSYASNTPALLQESQTDINQSLVLFGRISSWITAKH